MTLDISFDSNDTHMDVEFRENNQSMSVDFGEMQIVNAVSIKIEDEVAYIDY